jgi:thiosulfate/3-mercaptopyruvate sulfurtransferase
MKKIIFLFLLISLNLMNNVNAKDLLPGSLVTADWLSNNVNHVVILDTRKDLDSFTEEGHIENAILVDVTKIRIDREIDDKKLISMRPDAATFQQFMRQHGINNNSHVIITHRGKKPGHVAGAARLYWHFKYYGFDNVALLDGGNAAWESALEELISETSKTATGNYNVGEANPEILATMQQVREAVTNASTTLIDTREFRYHMGIDKKSYVFEYGHIPGSKNLPYKFLNPAKGTAVYFPANRLRTIVADLGIDTNKNLILYCNSAYECASDWFVLHEILGHKNVRVYDGSLHQWTQYEANPMTKTVNLENTQENILMTKSK